MNTTTIKISIEHKAQLEKLISEKLRRDFQKVKGKEKDLLFLELAQKKYGVSMDDMIEILIKRFTW